MSMSDLELHDEANRILATYSPGQVAKLIRLISPGSHHGFMSPEAFERVMAMMVGQSRGRSFSQRSRHAARLVLVMGAGIAEAAADAGLARQVVHRLMSRIRARMEALPADWLRVEVWLPATEAKQVMELATALRDVRDRPAEDMEKNV